MKHELRILSGPDQGRTFAIESGQTLSIGRGQASDTQLNDPHMSRVHCVLECDGGKVALRDNNSTGGTFVDGQKVNGVELKPGQTFKIGNTEIQFVLETGHEQSTLAPDSAFGRPKPKPDFKPLQELVGESFQDFRIDEIITQGSSGMVYRGTHEPSNKTVAIKVLTPDPSRKEEQKERFVRAMKTMLPVKHPNLVGLYNAGKKGPYLWAAMEYIEGESLDKLIDRIGVAGMLDWRDVFWVGYHVCLALEEAQKHQIIHRNVTPQNIMRQSSDKVSKLGDLMLAKALEGVNAQQVTKPGQMIGDLPYMSPERTRDGAEVDHRSDLYGLGATMYALLTGRPPVEGDSLPELVSKVRNQEPAPIKQFQMSAPELFADTVMQLLAKRPEDRPQDAKTVLKDLVRVAKYNGINV